jgi:hypothetical protein
MTAKTISLLVTPQQAVVLHAAHEIGGSVRLVLRNPEDEALVSDQGATVGDIFGDEHDKGNRTAEKATTPEKETSDVSGWLDQQAGKSTTTIPATPLPSAPPLPGEGKKMLVMMGSELVQIEIPGAGQLPVVQTEQGPADLGGNEPDPVSESSDFSPVPPPADDSEGDSSQDDSQEKEEASS